MIVGFALAFVGSFIVVALYSFYTARSDRARSARIWKKIKAQIEEEMNVRETD